MLMDDKNGRVSSVQDLLGLYVHSGNSHSDQPLMNGSIQERTQGCMDSSHEAGIGPRTAVATLRFHGQVDASSTR